MLRSSTYHHHGYAMALLGWGVIFKGVLISGLLFDFLLFLCLLFQLAMRVLLFGLDWRGIAFGFQLIRRETYAQGGIRGRERTDK